MMKVNSMLNFPVSIVAHKHHVWNIDLHIFTRENKNILRETRCAVPSIIETYIQYVMMLLVGEFI